MRAEEKSMNRYEMIIWWSAEDDAYVVDVPELPGCMAHGPTRQDAIKLPRTHQVLDQNCEGDDQEIPQPRGRFGLCVIVTAEPGSVANPPEQLIAKCRAQMKKKDISGCERNNCNIV